VYSTVSLAKNDWNDYEGIRADIVLVVTNQELYNYFPNSAIASSLVISYLKNPFLNFKYYFALGLVLEVTTLLIKFLLVARKLVIDPELSPSMCNSIVGFLLSFPGSNLQLKSVFGSTKSVTLFPEASTKIHSPALFLTT